MSHEAQDDPLGHADEMSQNEIPTLSADLNVATQVLELSYSVGGGF